MAQELKDVAEQLNFGLPGELSHVCALSSDFMHHAIPADLVRFRGILQRQDTSKKQSKNTIE